jgi:hypothetical protein
VQAKDNKMTVIYHCALVRIRDESPYLVDFTPRERSVTVKAMLRNGHAEIEGEEFEERVVITTVGRVALSRHIPRNRTKKKMAEELCRRNWCCPPPPPTPLDRSNPQDLLEFAQVRWPVGIRVVGHTFYEVPVWGFVTDHQTIDNRPSVIIQGDNGDLVILPITDLLKGNGHGRRARLEISRIQREQQRILEAFRRRRSRKNRGNRDAASHPRGSGQGVYRGQVLGLPKDVLRAVFEFA